MKNIKWLIQLADTRPLLFSIALLMLGIVSMYRLNKDKDERIKFLELDRKGIEDRCNHKIDSISSEFVKRELKLNEEVKKTLNDIIEGYKYQLEEQKQMRREITGALNQNKALINQTQSQLKKVK